MTSAPLEPCTLFAPDVLAPFRLSRGLTSLVALPEHVQ